MARGIKNALVPANAEERELLDPTPKSKRDIAYSNFSLDGDSVERAIDRINDTAARLHEQGFTNLSFDFEYYGYDGGGYLNIMGDRLETEAEITARLSTASITIRRQRETALGTEKKERDLLKRLKKKYPDG